MSAQFLTHEFSQPLNGETSVRIDIHAGDGNLTVDASTGGERMLASGTLQYFEKQGLPARSLASNDGLATFTLKGGTAGQPWFHFPWSACNGATEWQVHLNPTVSSDLTAHSDGGNLKLNLAGMILTRISADTGGGNVEVVLPENAPGLSVSAKTGAGNVDVLVPPGIAARIHATTGLGTAIIDPRFGKTGKNTYESSGFNTAANWVEITVQSGAGNVSVKTK